VKKLLRIKKAGPNFVGGPAFSKRLIKLSDRNFNPCRLFFYMHPSIYSVVACAALNGQPVEPAAVQQPFGASSAQQGFGQGIGQGLSQPSPAQHGFGQPVLQVVTEPSIDAISAAATFGQDTVWAVIGQQPPWA
jgi:hypothetical protein